jgi:hypothetical protein
MSRWADAGAWAGDGLRREVFFFRSGGEQLYGSLYAAADLFRPFGVVACGSWGIEADRSDPLVRSVALAMARLGGAGLVFHYPGYGDSFGDLDAVGLEDLSDAACDAVEQASQRLPGIAWAFAGFMLGASVACIAQQRAAVEALLLVQPALRPGAYFRRLADRPRPLALGAPGREMMEAGVVPGMAYGYPIPRRIVEHAGEADGAVSRALAEFDGEGTVVAHPTPKEPDHVPQRFQRIDVPGGWRFGSRNHPELAAATTNWLDQYTGGRDRR